MAPDAVLEALRAALALRDDASAEDVAAALEERAHGRGASGATLRATAEAIRTRNAAETRLATHARDALADLR